MDEDFSNLYWKARFAIMEGDGSVESATEFMRSALPRLRNLQRRLNPSLDRADQETLSCVGSFLDLLELAASPPNTEQRTTHCSLSFRPRHGNRVNRLANERLRSAALNQFYALKGQGLKTEAAVQEVLDSNKDKAGKPLFSRRTLFEWKSWYESTMRLIQRESP
ncbi:MAG TPA: hypothetical protein VMU59_11130 [Caulobacteraceae bacterium]|nr:hypothetical protein [Caulobacteraceae bacterium]